MHIRYIARDAGVSLANSARGAMVDSLKQPGRNWLLLSLKTDFASEWSRASAEKPSTLTITIDLPSLLPYWKLTAKLKVECSSFPVRDWRLHPDDSTVPSTGSSSWDVNRCSLISSNGRQQLMITGKHNGSSGVAPLVWESLSDLLVLIPLRQ